MECNCRILVSVIVLIHVGNLVTSTELMNNVSSATAIKLDGIVRPLPKHIKHSEPLLRKLNNQNTTITEYTNCSGLEVLNEEFQPKYSIETSFIRKCCPLGQSYKIEEKNDGNRRTCSDDPFNFTVPVLNATFYENCIEDNENSFNLEYAIGGACLNLSKNYQMILYSKSYGDLLYVLQNGSLLTVDENFAGYEVHHDYCLDIDRERGFVYAIICDRPISQHHQMVRAEAYLYSTCLLISVACLLLTAFFYQKIDELRDFHGKLLAFYCICLAIVYSGLSIIQLQFDITIFITYFIQYFLLTCICWLNVSCFDICIKISCTYWKKCSYSVDTKEKYLKIYAIVSFGLPIIPVILAYSKHTFGNPLYYIKGQHNIGIFTTDYFTVPVSILLFTCFCFLLMTLYIFGTTTPKLPHIVNQHNIQAISEYEEFFKLKQTAKSVAFLFGLMSICMLIEMVALHINIVTSDATTMSPFAFFNVLIALHGVFIFIIFICSPKPLRLVKRWWIAQGSLDVAAFTELEALKKNNTSNLE